MDGQNIAIVILVGALILAVLTIAGLVLGARAFTQITDLVALVSKYILSPDPNLELRASERPQEGDDLPDPTESTPTIQPGASQELPDTAGSNGHGPGPTYP